MLKIPKLKQIRTKKFIFWFLFWVLVVIPCVPFILGNFAYIAYVYWPRDVSAVTQFHIRPSTTSISVSAHGVNDNPSSWSDELQGLIQNNLENKKEKNHQHISLDWQPFSANPFICSVVGKKIGYDIGKIIAVKNKVNYVHAIGHSCGSFVVLGICEGARSQGRDIKIQSTYLDPVSIYAGFFWDYGVHHFGTCADFSDVYIDTSDTIPGSNQSLPHAHTFDVTQIRVTKNIAIHPHNWPARYYVEAYSDRTVPLLRQKTSAEKLYSTLQQGAMSTIPPVTRISYP